MRVTTNLLTSINTFASKLGTLNSKKRNLETESIYSKLIEIRTSLVKTTLRILVVRLKISKLSTRGCSGT